MENSIAQSWIAGVFSKLYFDRLEQVSLLDTMRRLQYSWTTGVEHHVQWCEAVRGDSALYSVRYTYKTYESIFR